MTEVDPIVLPDDIAKAGYCGTGLKTWCKSRGLDMMRLFRHEVHLSEIEAIDDALAIRVVAAVHARIGDQL